MPKDLPTPFTDAVIDPAVLDKIELRPDLGGEPVLGGSIGIDLSVVEKIHGKDPFPFDGPLPDFIPLDGRLTVPALRVSHADSSGRPDAVFAPGDVVRVTVDNGHFAEPPALTVTGPRGAAIAVTQPAAGATTAEIALPAGTAPGPYVVTANIAFGVTRLPLEVPVVGTAAFGVTAAGVPAVTLTRPVGPVVAPGSSTQVRVEVLASSLAPDVRLVDVVIDPASLRVRVDTSGVDATRIGIAAVAGSAPGPVVDATLTYPADLARATLVVTGVFTLNGARHEFEAIPGVVLGRISLLNVAQRVADQFLGRLSIALPLEPRDGDVRLYVPGIPVVPVLTSGLPGAGSSDVPGVAGAITSRVLTLPLPGAASPRDVVHVDLGVTWETEGVPVHLVRSPLDASGGPEVSLNDLTVGLVPIPTAASWFNPLAGRPPRPGSVPGLTLRATVTATVSAPAFDLPEATVGPVRLSLPNPVQVGLPVPELLALYRAPDMGTDWNGAPTNSHGDGAVAILTRVSNLPAPPDRALFAFDEPDPLPPGVRALVSLTPDDGLSRLGRLGQLLQLLIQPHRLPVPGGSPLDVGLATLRTLPVVPGSAVAGALSPLLALLTSVEVFAASIARLVALTAQKDPARPDTYIRVLPGVGRLPVAHLGTPFIRHSDFLHGSDVNIEDETESLLLLGGPQSSVTLYCDRERRLDHGAATFETNGGFCCLEARLSSVGSGYTANGTYPLRPLGDPAPASPPDGVTFGRVRASERVNPTEGPRLGGPGEAFHQTLARSVSSFAFGAPL